MLPRLVVPITVRLPPIYALPEVVREVEEAAPALVTAKFWPPILRALAEREPREVPPLTVNPVVVALPDEMLARVERPLTVNVPPKYELPRTDKGKPGVEEAMPT